MKRKLNSRRGITLTELLVALALLGILSALVVTGVNASLELYRRSVALSRIQTTLSTLVAAVGNEARMSQTETPDITLDEETGQLMKGTELLVGDGVYSEGSLRVDTFSLSYDNSTGLFALDMTVKGDKEASMGAVTQFRRLNHAPVR